MSAAIADLQMLQPGKEVNCLPSVVQNLSPLSNYFSTMLTTVRSIPCGERARRLLNFSLFFIFPAPLNFPILFFSQGVSSGVKFVSYDTPSAKYTPTHIVFIVNSGACRWTYKLLQDTAKNKIYLYCIYFLYTISLHATYMWYVISVYTCRVLVTYQLPFLKGSVFLESLQLVCKVIPAEFSSDFPLFCPYSSVYFPALFLAGVC